MNVKTFVCIALVILLCMCCCLSVSAHSGGTDWRGGHKSGNGYHYHHGHSAHDHEGGICSYEASNYYTTIILIMCVVALIVYKTLKRMFNIKDTKDSYWTRRPSQKEESRKLTMLRLGVLGTLVLAITILYIYFPYDTQYTP